MTTQFFDYYQRENHFNESGDLHETDSLGLAAFVCRNMALLDEIKPNQNNISNLSGTEIINCKFINCKFEEL